MLKRLIYFFAVLQLMAGCSVIPTIAPDGEQASLQLQRTAIAQNELEALEQIDTLLKINNRWLSDWIKQKLLEQAVLSEQHTIRRLRLDFGRQAILLDVQLDIHDGQGNTISATLEGEILLDYSGAQLEWIPLIYQFDINSTDFEFADGVYAEPSPELIQQTSQEFDATVTQALLAQGNNHIPLEAIPLGEVSVGAALPNFTDNLATRTRQLRGQFMVSGSASLVESAVTTLALDMTFVPDLSTCPADVTVSRAGFTHDIKSREPVGIAHSLSEGDEIDFFYSEISGARQPLTIIHYWFADGLPIVAEELPVGESYRWRTWSDRGSDGADASRWEVLVVEKESGCILHSQTIRAPETELDLAPAQASDARRAFVDLRETFTARTSGFTITSDKPGIALIEITRPFLGEVLRASLSDLSLDASFDEPSMKTLQFGTSLQPFATQDIACEQRECAPPPVCKANLTQCKRLRDTRDCSSCEFRNPLNNRCVSEAIDPMCEASRKRQNTRYDAERAACITDAETLKRECDEQTEQALRSCEIEAGFEDSACEAVKNSLRGLAGGAQLARLSTHAAVNGTLVVNFSNFRLGQELETLTLDIALLPDLRLDGELEFEPTDIAKPLADCIQAWSAPYTARLVTAPVVNELLNNLEPGDDRLTANWSGFGLETTIRPSPLRTVFVSNPQLLANCRIGLTPARVESAIAGDDAQFFTGSMGLQVLPLPTTIQLAPATVVFGDRRYSAEPRLQDSHLRYDIED